MAVEFRDYYKTLGVARDATPAEIKKAFRKLARKHHPDMASDKEQAEEKFKAINEAYEVLGDPEKRSKYDRYGENWEHGGTPRGWSSSTSGFPGGSHYEYSFDGSTGFSDFFEELFGRRTAGDPFGAFHSSHGSAGRGPRAGRDVESDFLISLDELMNGGERRLRLQNSETGKVKTIKVQIPKGVSEGTLIRCSGLGEPGSEGGKAGDLFLRVRLERHPFFVYDGSTVTTDIELFPWECVLGTQKVIKTPKGNVRLKIPEGTQAGTIFRVPGHGLPEGSGFGVFCAQVKVTIPENISIEEEELWGAIAKAHPTTKRD